MNEYILKCPKCECEYFHITGISKINHNLNIDYNRTEFDIILDVSCESLCGIKQILLTHHEGNTLVMDKE